MRWLKPTHCARHRRFYIEAHPPHYSVISIMAEKTVPDTELLSRHVDLHLQKINKHGKSLRIYTVGTNGVGKSTLVKDLVGPKAKEVPKIAHGPKPCTMKATEYEIPVADGVSVLVYDTRGMFDDKSGEHEEATANLIGEVCNNDVNGVLLVCMEMYGRLGDSTIKMIAKLHHKYGKQAENIWRYAIFVLTKADRYPVEWDDSIRWWERSAPILKENFETSLQEYKDYLRETFTMPKDKVTKECYIGMTEEQFDELEIPVLPTSTLSESALSKMIAMKQEDCFDMLLVECCRREQGVVLVNIHSERIANLPFAIIKKD